MTAHKTDFGRELLAIGDASAAVLSRLYEVVEAQQRGVLALAEGGHVPVQAGGAGQERVAALIKALSPASAPAGEPARSQADEAAASPAETPSEAHGETPSEAPAEAPANGAEALLELGLRASRALSKEAPRAALAELQHVVVHAVGLALYNVVAQQQNLATLAQAVITMEASGRLGGGRATAVQEAPGKDAARAAGETGPRAVAR